MVFVALILGLPLARWLSTFWRDAAAAFWFLGCVDDAELFVFGCPSRFASADGHNWEALQHRTPSAEPLGYKPSSGGRVRLVVVSRVLSERLRGRIAIFHRWLRSSRSVLFVQRARISRIPSLG